MSTFMTHPISGSKTPMVSESASILSEKRLYFRFPYENAALLRKWYK